METGPVTGAAASSTPARSRWWRRIPLTVSLPLTAVVLAAAVGTAVILGASRGGTPGGPPAVGRPAPAWTGTTLSGTRLSSTSLRGSWVVLNVFASWCIPCREETGRLRAFADGPAAARHTRIVGILYSDSPARARRFVAAEGISWPIVSGGAERIAERFDLRGLPESFVIDPTGRLVEEIFGGVTVAKLEAVIPGR